MGNIALVHSLTNGSNRSLRSLGRAKARPLTKRYIPGRKMRILTISLFLLLSGCIVYLPPPQNHVKKPTRSYQPCLNAPACETEIINIISNNWYRPDDAKNGLEVEVLLGLNPGGAITSIQILKQSGSESFDMSTLLAIARSAPFSELKGLDSVEFDRLYRHRVIIFRPEDLDGN